MRNNIYIEREFYYQFALNACTLRADNRGPLIRILRATVQRAPAPALESYLVLICYLCSYDAKQVADQLKFNHFFLSLNFVFPLYDLIDEK